MLGKCMKAAAVLAVGVALHAAGGQGSDVSNETGLPNGKPFRTIESRIDALVGQVGSIEERMRRLEYGISELQAQNDALQQQIERNAHNIGELQDDMEANTLLIARMREDIARIETLLALKQNIIGGSCPEGSSIREVREDGSVACEIDDKGGGAAFARFVFLDSAAIAPSASVSVTVECWSGYTLTGGGFHASSDAVEVFTSRPTFHGGMWHVEAKNSRTDAPEEIMVYANCIRPR